MAHLPTTVLAFGSFDILHPGHIAYLTQARQQGDRLVVVIAKDHTIERYKAKKPYLNERERAFMLSQLKLVDQVIIGDAQDPYKVIRKVKPQVLCLGYDQQLFVDGLRDFLQKNNMTTRVVIMKAKLPRKYKSTNIKLSMNP
jgi:FAD synthetase